MYLDLNEWEQIQNRIQALESQRDQARNDHQRLKDRFKHLFPDTMITRHTMQVHAARDQLNLDDVVKINFNYHMRVTDLQDLPRTEQINYITDWAEDSSKAVFQTIAFELAKKRDELYNKGK